MMQPDYTSSYLSAGLSRTRPAFDFFSVDSLGKSQVDFNPVLALPADPVSVRLENSGGVFSYFPRFSAISEAPVWRVRFSEKSIVLRSEYVDTGSALPGMAPPMDFGLTFRQKACHATLLGLMSAGESKVQLPCVLHLPDMGSLRVSSTVPDSKLAYASSRAVEPPMVRFVDISFPAATSRQPIVEYTLEVASIYPELDGIEADTRFDGFRRNFLNMFQLIPRRQMLGTNASSDICPFTLYMFAEAASRQLRLAEGLYTFDLVRMTADRYLSGVKGYGQVGYEHGVGEYQFLDINPSLILGSGIYVESALDWNWAQSRHGAIMALCREMLEGDRNGNGLIEYGTTGNYGDRPTPRQRPANWWDTINFGHEDAYSNALACCALETWAAISARIGKSEDALWLKQKATRMKAAYCDNFLNPETGILAGWKSADGQLHDYWFLFLNSVAVAYGVVEGELANTIMDRLLRKLDEVGFRNFRLGLPGNLVPVRRGDYLDDSFGDNPELAKLFGVPQLEDGSDAFTYYENGGASMRYAVFTLKALYKLGRAEEARKILYPMLEGYKAGDYQGFDANGVSNDWRTWQGGACGYEGFAVGNFLPLLAVLDEWEARNAKNSMKLPGRRPGQQKPNASTRDV
ncbi:MAG: hypothetical protein ACFUZC_08585 [Chthoniobacteraceae bacterium]